MKNPCNETSGHKAYLYQLINGEENWKIWVSQPSASDK